MPVNAELLITLVSNLMSRITFKSAMVMVHANVANVNVIK